MAAPRILVANRGEIAVRVLSSARELGLQTLTLFIAEDDAHVSYAHERIELPSASSYTDVKLLVSLCRKHHVDLVHPGYGFLSESADFCEQLDAAGVAFIGPDSDTLRRTGDKLSARKLAEVCGVPVLPALLKPVENLETLRYFTQDVGLPVMIKAVDGGGGRGIRLVHQESELEANFFRAKSESPSKQCFAEKAAIGGFRHVEVQILGDGLGNVRHFWERECSIQRRFQKVVEVAPSTIADRDLLGSVIDAAVRMATAIRYSSLGTWEFLVSPETSTFYFMEINPRLQVEHTITEVICGADLVRWQILLALGRSIFDLDLDHLGSSDARAPPPPNSTAIQLRVTAEDTRHGFSASIGRIRQVLFPGGQGVRVDSHVRPGVVVSTDFDSLLAKLIVAGPDWTAAVAKAERALQDVVIDGFQTNIGLLQSIVRSQSFRARVFDVQWLENQLDNLTRESQVYTRHANSEAFKNERVSESLISHPSTPSGRLVRTGDRFNVQFEAECQSANLGHGTLSVKKVIKNDFPISLALKLALHTIGGSVPDGDYTLRVSKLSETQPGQQSGPQRKQAAAGDSSQLICPMAGRLIEVLVDDGDHVAEGDAILIVRQMKMELEVRAHRPGVIQCLFDVEEGKDVSVGSVICSIRPSEKERL